MFEWRIHRWFVVFGQTYCQIWVDISALELKIDVSWSIFLIVCYDVASVYSCCIECWVYLSFRFDVYVSNTIFKLSFYIILILFEECSLSLFCSSVDCWFHASVIAWFYDDIVVIRAFVVPWFCDSIWFRDSMIPWFCAFCGVMILWFAGIRYSLTFLCWLLHL